MLQQGCLGLSCLLLCCPVFMLLPVNPCPCGTCPPRCSSPVVQADLDATREQRGQLEGQCQQLAQDLRDAIYSLGQVHAQHQGQAVSWAVRGLKSAGVQTQYCELWESNLGGTAGTCHNSAGAINGTACVAGSGSGNGSVLWAAAQESSSGSSRGGSGEASENGGEADASSGVEVQGQEEAAAARVLPLPALRQAIQDIYRAKAIADIAVARGQSPFLPLADFLAAYLAQQHGAEGAAVQQRAQQLQASVEAHAGVWEVGLFGLAAGMLEEAENWDAAPPGSAPAILVRPPGSSSPSAAAPPPSAAADAVPLVLYHSRRRRGTPSQLQHGEALWSLRRFCGASWLAAFRRSAALCPAGPDQLLHGMAAELHNLALSVPGMEQLAAWVLGGGVGACLPQLDLGLRLAENQVRAWGLWSLTSRVQAMPSKRCCKGWLRRGLAITILPVGCWPGLAWPAGAPALPAGGREQPPARPGHHAAAVCEEQRGGCRLLPAAA